MIKIDVLEKLLENRRCILVSKKVDLQDQIKKAILKNKNFNSGKHLEKVSSFSLNISNAVERDIEFNDKRSIKKLLDFLSNDIDLGEVINKILNMKLNLPMVF